MNPTLRRAGAHVLVDDVTRPTLDDAAGHHLFRVLRIGDGETVTVTDGAGHWRSCRARAGTIEPDGEMAFVPRRAEPITVAVAIPKQDRPEWLVQKLTELGVDPNPITEGYRAEYESIKKTNKDMLLDRLSEEIKK